LCAQDARELEQERTASKKLKGEHPLLELMRTRKSSLRPELMGVHRVFTSPTKSLLNCANALALPTASSGRGQSAT
jgi:hypothetical protein